MKPVAVFIDGQLLEGWTEMTLSREKEKLTGELNIGIFMGYIPETPCMVDACRGREITVYIGGHQAFIGYIDKRRGTGKHNPEGKHKSQAESKDTANGSGGGGGSRSLSIGPNEYTVTITARGKTKYLIDSSHQHPTTNMVKPSSKQVVEKLIEPWQDKVQVEWMGTDVKLDKVRFRDGCRVVDELHRVCCENCYYMYETRDGKLRVSDGSGQTEGEPIVLGINILTFSAEQSEDKAKSQIKVKGQRTDKNIRGKDAVVETVKKVEDQWVGTNLPFTVQHFGDATPEALERRAQFEANARSSASKEITLDVFHVQTPSGQPWDIGQLHYVEIPPEGIFDMFECTKVSYSVKADKELKTTLTLSPPPSSSLGAASSGISLPATPSQYVAIGNSRRAAAGITFAPGRYPSPWTGPNLMVMPFISLAASLVTSGLTLLSSLNGNKNPMPKRLSDDNVRGL